MASKTQAFIFKVCTGGRKILRPYPYAYTFWYEMQKSRWPFGHRDFWFWDVENRQFAFGFAC